MNSNQTVDKLHERIAKCLDWTVKDVRSFGLTTLQSMVREKDARLYADIAECVRNERHFTSGPVKPRRRW